MKYLKERKVELSLIAILLMIVFWKSCGTNKDEQKITLLELLQDSLKRTRSDKGELEAKIGLFQSDNIAMFSKLKSADSTVNWLQDEVKKHKKLLKEKGSSAAVIAAVTTFSTSDSTEITKIEPVKQGKSDTIILYPVYEAKSRDTTWIKYAAKASKEKFDISLSVKDKYTVIIGEEGGFFKKKKPLVLVTSQNPYTNITEMRAYQVTDKTKPKRLGLGVQVGYGFGAGGLTPYIGVGLNYTLIRIY